MHSGWILMGLMLDFLDAEVEVVLAYKVVVAHVKRTLVEGGDRGGLAAR